MLSCTIDGGTCTMPDYRRAYIPGGTVFLTMVTHGRMPLFQCPENVGRLREALRQVMQEQPFRIPAAVVLPDHVHFLWSLPRDDADYSRRVGRMKVSFTRSLRTGRFSPSLVSNSRRKHRESDIWQRRFWEHVVRDEADFERLLNYVHYNPVRHGLVGCPHQWPFSSFGKWVEAGLYPVEWGCSCQGRHPVLPVMIDNVIEFGE
jgi:putative transposase